MKKIILLSCLAIATATTAIVGFSSYAPSPATVGPVTSTYYTVYTVSPVYQGVVDTFSSAAADTHSVAFSGNPKLITFTNDVYKVAGTPTVTAACYASANFGVSYAQTPIATFTVSPTSLTVPQDNIAIINSGFGCNPYTNYMWVASTSASATVSWQGFLLARQ